MTQVEASSTEGLMLSALVRFTLTLLCLRVLGRRAEVKGHLSHPSLFGSEGRWRLSVLLFGCSLLLLKPFDFGVRVKEEPLLSYFSFVLELGVVEQTVAEISLSRLARLRHSRLGSIPKQFDHQSMRLILVLLFFFVFRQQSCVAFDDAIKRELNPFGWLEFGQGSTLLGPLVLSSLLPLRTDYYKLVVLAHCTGLKTSSQVRLRRSQD